MNNVCRLFRESAPERLLSDVIASRPTSVMVAWQSEDGSSNSAAAWRGGDNAHAILGAAMTAVVDSVRARSLRPLAGAMMTLVGELVDDMNGWRGR